MNITTVAKQQHYIVVLRLIHSVLHSKLFHYVRGDYVIVLSELFIFLIISVQ